MTRLGIVSYCDTFRTLAHVNHESYAREHSYTYIFDIAPTTSTTYFAKVEKIRKFLPLFDWVFWIDDDAFFMQRSVGLEEFPARAEGAEVIFCSSPPRGSESGFSTWWTWLSSGNFLIRNTPEALRLLDAVLATDLTKVAEWWDAEEFGNYTKGDQDAFVFQLATDPVFSREGFAARLPFEAFNTRPEHFVQGPDDHFLVHFTGGNKRGQARQFGKRFGLTEALVTRDELSAYNAVFRPSTSGQVHTEHLVRLARRVGRRVLQRS
jgi:hypothetical protein